MEPWFADLINTLDKCMACAMTTRRTPLKMKRGRQSTSHGRARRTTPAGKERQEGTGRTDKCHRGMGDKVQNAGSRVGMNSNLDTAMRQHGDGAIIVVWNRTSMQPRMKLGTGLCHTHHQPDCKRQTGRRGVPRSALNHCAGLL